MDDRSSFSCRPSPAAAASREAPPACRLVTLGCKVNQYETQLVREALLSAGFREADEDEPAELCVVNTCTVTAEADGKARQLIRKLARRDPHARTIVMGCYATREPQALAALPGVVEVVADKRELPDVLHRQAVAELPRGIARFSGRHRAFVKVQDGCILKCSFCIIPYVRPRLRSREPEEIVDEVRRLVGNGFKEIVLTGIHLGHYGVELTRAKSGRPRFRLPHLVERLDALPGEFRIRLSSIEAYEVDDDFIARTSQCQKLCPHFHPSLQSGSDAVLARMRRRYRVGRFLEKLDRFRARFADPAFSTDVIVGFPGETDADFEATLRACKEAGFMKIHVFPFSARRGTPAATMPDQIPAAVIRERHERMQELERQLAEGFARRAIERSHRGEPLVVLGERVVAAQEGHEVRGTACRYLQVTYAGGPEDEGRLAAVHAISAEGGLVCGVKAG